MDYAIYLDLDGVMADYDAGIRELGFVPDPSKKNELNRSGTKDPFKRVMYEAIQGTDFYFTLPFMRGAVDLYRRVEAHEPIILTAAPKFGASEDDYFVNPHWLGAAYHKRRWVEDVLLRAVQERNTARGIYGGIDKRVPIPDERFVCTTSARKQDFLGRKHSEHQILIDDRRDNCVRWARAGGVAILHKHCDETIDALSLFKHGLSQFNPAYYQKLDNGGVVLGLDDARTWDELEAAAARNVD